MIAPYPLYRLDNRILEIMQGPEDRLGTQRLQVGPERCAINPKVSSFLEYGLLESGDHFRNPEVFVRTRRSSKNPEVYLDHEIIFWDPEAVGEPGGSPLDPGIMTGPRRLYGNPEILR